MPASAPLIFRFCKIRRIRCRVADRRCERCMKYSRANQLLFRPSNPRTIHYPPCFISPAHCKWMVWYRVMTQVGICSWVGYANFSHHHSTEHQTFLSCNSNLRNGYLYSNWERTNRLNFSNTEFCVDSIVRSCRCHHPIHRPSSPVIAPRTKNHRSPKRQPQHKAHCNRDPFP